MKLSSLIDEYLRSLIMRDVSTLTYRDYSHYLSKFLDFTKDIDTSKITISTISAYKKHLANYYDPETGLGLKRVTQNYFLIALRSLIEYADIKNVTTLSKDDIELIKITKEAPKAIDKKAIEGLLALPDVHTDSGLRDRAILETLFSTGLLVSDLSYLNRNQVDLVKQEIKLESRDGEIRVIYLFDRCVYWLDKYLSSREDLFVPLFIRYQGNIEHVENGEKMRLTARSIQRIVEKYAKIAGLGGKITPQTFRHFLKINLMDQGLSLKEVANAMGYKSNMSLLPYVKKEQHGRPGNI